LPVESGSQVAAGGTQQRGEDDRVARGSTRAAKSFTRRPSSCIRTIRNATVDDVLISVLLVRSCRKSPLPSPDRPAATRTRPSPVTV